MKTVTAHYIPEKAESYSTTCVCAREKERESLWDVRVCWSVTKQCVPSVWLLVTEQQSPWLKNWHAFWSVWSKTPDLASRDSPKYVTNMQGIIKGLFSAITRLSCGCCPGLFKSLQPSFRQSWKRCLYCFCSDLLENQYELYEIAGDVNKSVK